LSRNVLVTQFISF